jgi:hypothetical protein
MMISAMYGVSLWIGRGEESMRTIEAHNRIYREGRAILRKPLIYLHQFPVRMFLAGGEEEVSWTD